VLRAILELALRRHGIVIVLASALAVYGVWSTSRAEFDVFPEFVPPQVVVQTESPGLAPEQVERLVTVPIESAVSGLLSLETLRSESAQGLSVVTVNFREGTDAFVARQQLAESLAELTARLPAGVRAPTVSPLTSSTMDVLKIGLVSQRLSPMELRSLAEWTLRPRLLMVPGVARANVFGGEVRELQVRVRPERLRAYRVGLLDLVRAASGGTGVRGGGFVDTPGQRIVVESRGEVGSAAELGGALVTAGVGVPVRLEDLADVREAAAPAFGDALVQGEPGVLVTLSSQFGANTLDVTHGLEAALADLAPGLEAAGVRVYPAMHRPANFIESALRNLRFSVLLGSGLVAVVLIAFLRDLRSALISLTAIPLSLLTAVIVLDRLGISLNTMTLGGLAIAIGEVVDDAIVDVENIVRRLRENAGVGHPRPAWIVVRDASLEVRGAVVYATLAVGIVFLPLLGLSGLQGRFFAPLAQAYLLAVLASLGVALTVTPALSLALLGSRPPTQDEPRLQTMLKARYARVLEWSRSHASVLIAAIAVLLLGSLALIPRLGGEFLPAFRERHLVLQVTASPGTSLVEMRRVGTIISRALLALPAVSTVEQQLGRAEQGEDTWGPHRSEFHVELRDVSARQEEEATDAIRALLAAIPGVQTEVLTFLGDRISETISGETASVVVNVFGEDLDLLDAKAREIAAVLESIPGAVDVTARSTEAAPRVAVTVDPERAARFGFRVDELLDQVQVAYAGALVGQTHRGSQTIDVRVILDADLRTEPQAVGALLVSNARGEAIPLATLAEVSIGEGRDTISHEGGRRRQTVTCNVRDRDVASFVDEVESTVRAKVSLPPASYLIVGGIAEARQRAEREILLHAGFGLMGVILLLATAAGHWRNLLLLLANVPLAAIGGIMALAIQAGLSRGSSGLSLGALVGFVTLLGITLRNSIMLLSHLQHLVEHEGAPWGWETAARGASERLAPILMTALVTGLGLLPLALASGRPGGEIDGPMATVILGGLVSSTALNLLVLPVACARFGRFVAAGEDLVPTRPSANPTPGL
jgi:CzcA family heavy metal efflux pump